MQFITSQGSHNSIFVSHKMVSRSITESTPIPVFLAPNTLAWSTRAHKLQSLACCSGQIPVLPLYLCPCHPIDLICRTIFSVKRPHGDLSEFKQIWRLTMPLRVGLQHNHRRFSHLQTLSSEGRDCESPQSCLFGWRPVHPSAQAMAFREDGLNQSLI